MAEIISIENFPVTNIAEQTRLTADAAAGQKIFAVENANGFLADYFYLIGFKGSETGEKGQVDTISGLAITGLANLGFKHIQNEPVYRLRANQAKIYRAANVNGEQPEDAAFSAIATVDLDFDQLFTEYIDDAGGDGYWYKYTFYNSDTVYESDLSDAEAVRGGAFGLYCTVDDVRQEAGLVNNRYITDQLIYSKLTKAQSEVSASLLVGGYTLPLTSVPGDVANATQLLAAGYLLTMDYGPEFNGTNKDGARKIQQARDILTKIESGDKPLVSPTGEFMPSKSQVKGYPDDSAPAPMFTSQDRF